MATRLGDDSARAAPHPIKRSTPNMPIRSFAAPIFFIGFKKTIMCAPDDERSAKQSLTVGRLHFRI